MIKVGLTGGIGSGKTTVAWIFSILGVPVFSADAEGKRLMAEDADLARAIMNAFGDDVYTRNDSGALIPDRKKLADIVFSDPAALERLNALVHPAVIAAFDIWSAKKETETPYVIKESALLFESEAWKHTDVNIVVTAPEEERIRRVVARDNVDAEKVRQRMARQLPEEEKVSRAGMVIKNDNRELVIPQVLAIHRLLLHPPADLLAGRG